jgi:hypothetical protein
MSSFKEKASEVTDKAFAARDLLKDAKATISTNIDNMGGHIERAKLLSKDAVNIGTGGVRADVITSVMMTEMSTIVSGLSLLVICTHKSTYCTSFANISHNSHYSFFIFNL